MAYVSADSYAPVIEYKVVPRLHFSHLLSNINGEHDMENSRGFLFLLSNVFTLEDILITFH